MNTHTLTHSHAHTLTHSLSPLRPPPTLPSAVAGQSAGAILRVDTLPEAFYGLDSRPNWNAMGRLYVHGPSGNVAVGDISKAGLGTRCHSLGTAKFC